MKRYDLVSGVFFAIVSLVQLARTILGWPISINGIDIPVWCSGLAFLIAGGFAIWAFRSASRTTGTM